MAAKGIPDVPWSSRKRLVGVLLSCMTFALWIVSGATCLVLFVLGGTYARLAIALYFLAAALYTVPMSPAVHRFACWCEAGAENGWQLIVKGKVDCTDKAHLFVSHPHGIFCAGAALNLVLSGKGLAAVGATRGGIRMYVHSLLADVFPLVKDFLRAMGKGGVQPATRVSFTREVARSTATGGPFDEL